MGFRAVPNKKAVIKFGTEGTEEGSIPESEVERRFMKNLRDFMENMKACTRDLSDMCHSMGLDVEEVVGIL